MQKKISVTLLGFSGLLSTHLMCMFTLHANGAIPDHPFLLCATSILWCNHGWPPHVITPAQVTGSNGAGVFIGSVVTVGTCSYIPQGGSMTRSQSGPQVAVLRRSVTDHHFHPIVSAKANHHWKSTSQSCQQKRNWKKKLNRQPQPSFREASTPWHWIPVHTWLH